MKKKVGLFGGSFDPIHLGHLNLAINLLEKCHLDEVLFCPAALSPFKTHAPPKASIAHRIKMIQLSIQEVSGFTLLDWEAKGDGPTYTIDTVRHLIKDPSLELHLLMGEDHLDSLDRWKEADELIRLGSPFVASREVPREEIFAPGINKIKIPLFDISSTEVRKRLLEKKYCGHLVPALVLDYIEQNQLYC